MSSGETLTKELRNLRRIISLIIGKQQIEQKVLESRNRRI